MSEIETLNEAAEPFSRKYIKSNEVICKNDTDIEMCEKCKKWKSIKSFSWIYLPVPSKERQTVLKAMAVYSMIAIMWRWYIVHYVPYIIYVYIKYFWCT